MSNTPIQDILNDSMQHLRELIGAETIIGKEIKTESGTTIIPVSKVNFGFASGGSDMPTSKPKDLFGGGSGGGVTISPIAFLVISPEGDVRMMQISENSNNAGRALNMIPEVLNQVVGFIQKKTGKDGEDPAKAEGADKGEPSSDDEKKEDGNS